MSKFYISFVVALMLFCSLTDAIVNAQVSSKAEIVKTEVRLDSNLDMTGVTSMSQSSISGVFLPGFYKTMVADLAWDIYFSTGNANKKIRSIDIIASRNNGAIWSTYLRTSKFPLVVYSEGSKKVGSWVPEISTFVRGKVHKITVYGQPTYPSQLTSEFWSNNNDSGLVAVITFTDLSVISSVITIAGTPTANVANLPSITKADFQKGEKYDLINQPEVGSLSSFGIPGDNVFDISLNMNGTNKVISYIAIKKSDQSTNLWSSNKTGNSGEGQIGYNSVDLSKLPYGLLVTRDGKRLNDPNTTNKPNSNSVYNPLGGYSGQNINFRLYADGFAGSDFTGNSIVYVVFEDGTIVSKNINIVDKQNSDQSLPSIKSATLGDNTKPIADQMHSYAGNPKYWRWDVDLDMKNKSKRAVYFSVSMRNLRWSSDDSQGSLLRIYEGIRPLNNGSTKSIGTLSGNKKYSIYGLIENNLRYDNNGIDSIFIMFDDGTFVSEKISGETISTIFTNKDVEFPSLPNNKTIGYELLTYRGLVLSWEPATDNVGVVGYKIYRSELIIPPNASSYYAPSVLIADVKTNSYVDNDPKLVVDKRYAYKINAYDSAGNSSYDYSTLIHVTELFERPSTPSKVTTKAYSADRITIEWTNDSIDNGKIAGYKIYRNDELIAVIELSDLGSAIVGKYVDIVTNKNISYNYSVKAFDEKGYESRPRYTYANDIIYPTTGTITNPSTGTGTVTNPTRDTQAPSAPYNLTVRAVSTSRIDFSWSPSSDNVGVVGYKIFRDEREISSITGTSYSDNGLSADSAYTYYIKAYDAAGNLSQRSSSLTEFTTAPTTVTTTRDTQAPSYPPNLAVRPVSSSQMDITWSPSSDNVGVTGYIVYRNNSEIARTTNLSYRDSGLSAGTDYNYNVKAYDAAGNQSYMSNSVTEWTLDGVSLRNVRSVNYLSSAINAVTQILLGKELVK
jgi:chitodextrinase